MKYFNVLKIIGILGVFALQPATALDMGINMGKIKKGLTNAKSSRPGISPLDIKNKCTSGSQEKDCLTDYFEVRNSGGKNRWEVEVKYIHDMEMIKKPGLQIKFHEEGNANTAFAYYSQMAIYDLVLANQGKSEIPMFVGKTTGTSQWQSKDGSEYFKAFLLVEGGFPKTLKAKIEMAVAGMKKTSRTYPVPFKLIDYNKALPEAIPLPKEGKEALMCRNPGDKCIEPFKVRELHKDWEISVYPIERQCGDRGYKGERPCLQIKVGMNRVGQTSTFSKGLAEIWSGSAQNEIYPLSSEEYGEWKSEDGTSWVKQFLVLGAKPKARIEIKLSSLATPLVREYELPFEL